MHFYIAYGYAKIKARNLHNANLDCQFFFYLPARFDNTILFLINYLEKRLQFMLFCPFLRGEYAKSKHIYLFLVCIAVRSVVLNVRRKSEICRCPQHEGLRGNINIAPLILNLGSRRRRLVSFSSRTLYPGDRNLVVIAEEGVGAPETDWTSVANVTVVVEYEVPSLHLVYK